jgi:hypothetical protein
VVISTITRERVSALVLCCTGITHKDLWIHTCVLGIPCGKSKSQSTQGEDKNDPRPGGHAEPTEVGGAGNGLKQRCQEGEKDKCLIQLWKGR